MFGNGWVCLDDVTENHHQGCKGDIDRNGRDRGTFAPGAIIQDAEVSKLDTWRVRIVATEWLRHVRFHSSAQYPSLGNVLLIIERYPEHSRRDR